MTLASRADVTTLLRAWSAGDQAAKEKLRGRLVFTAVVTAVTSSAHCTAMDNTASAVATNAAQVTNAGKITCRLAGTTGLSK